MEEQRFRFIKILTIDEPGISIPGLGKQVRRGQQCDHQQDKQFQAKYRNGMSNGHETRIGFRMVDQLLPVDIWTD